MELLCPECRGALVSTDARTARCTVHAGEYTVLFMRTPPPAVVPAPTDAASVGMCVNHPDLRAFFICGNCGQSICELCAFTREDGSRVCANCVSSSPGVPGASPPIVSLGVAPPLNVGSLKCLQHPEVGAVQLCKSCGAPVCATCDFLLPGNIHLCPRCVAAPPKRISGGRKKLLIAAYALAVWNTVALALFMIASAAGMFKGKEQQAALGIIYSLLIFMPSLIGLGLSVGCLDRRLRNPAAVWGVIVWNGLFLLLHLIFVVIGNLKS